MEELIKELREYAKHAQWQAPGKAADALEAQQARIAELDSALLEAADEIEKLRGELENANVAWRDARSIVVACRGSVKTDLNAYERLLIAKKKHNEQQTPTYIAAEAEAQRLFDLLAKIDAWALTTPNA